MEGQLTDVGKGTEGRDRLKEGQEGITAKGTGTEKGQMDMDRRTGTVTDRQGQEQGKEDRNGDLQKGTWKGGLDSNRNTTDGQE